MLDLKPQTASGYSPQDLERVRTACLSLATYLGSFKDDVVIVGGLVPTLLIPTKGIQAHVGTRELDVGLDLAILEESRYVDLVAQLKSADFSPDVTKRGAPANHRWKHKTEGVTVDFLIAPTAPAPTTGNTKIRAIDENLSAVLASGLPLAFRDKRKIAITGKTFDGADATRELWVCGAGAFTVLKALAFKGRGANKDAYDLFYVLQNFGESYITDVASALRPLLDHPTAQEALEIIKADFRSANALGPKRAAAFLDRDKEEDYRADLAGAAAELLRLLGWSVEPRRR